ncbi:hypothetical protein SUGI_0484680 [Cryptomeria japonica]|nr:hypothetical protein SUGI_0484680 [Cryptomeria japonica]
MRTASFSRPSVESFLILRLRLTTDGIVSYSKLNEQNHLHRLTIRIRPHYLCNPGVQSNNIGILYHIWKTSCDHDDALEEERDRGWY